MSAPLDSEKSCPVDGCNWAGEVHFHDPTFGPIVGYASPEDFDAACDQWEADGGTFPEPPA